MLGQCSIALAGNGLEIKIGGGGKETLVFAPFAQQSGAQLEQRRDRCAARRTLRPCEAYLSSLLCALSPLVLSTG